MKDRPLKIRLYVPQALATGATVDLAAEQAHYLAQVMRRRIGDRLEIFNGENGAFEAEIMDISRKSVSVQCYEQLRVPSQMPDIWLVFVPVKRARLDFIAQKATEMGVSKIWPVQSDFGQVSRLKDTRLEANAIEAAEQTERLDIPEIGKFDALDDVLANWPADRVLIFCDEAKAGAGDASDLFSNLRRINGQKAGIVIGPEGGFSAAERKRISEMQNCLPIALGPRILRADTAAIAALALYQACAGDWYPKS